MTPAAQRLRVAEPRRRPLPLSDRPPQRAGRDDIRAGLRKPLGEAWRRPPRVTPELIAAYRQRAHRLRSRMLRRAIFRAWRRIAGLLRRVVRSEPVG